MLQISAYSHQPSASPIYFQATLISSEGVLGWNESKCEKVE